jgi:3-dehydroquinate dehydratase II
MLATSAAMLPTATRRGSPLSVMLISAMHAPYRGGRAPRNRKQLPLRTIFVLNGPNLNRLGKREPEIYGTQTLTDIGAMLTAHAAGRATIDLRQTNHEGTLVDWLHEAADSGVHAVLLNAGAYTHTSIALLDSIKAISPLPVFEVHLSDPMAREPFRHISYVGMVAAGHFAGLGAQSYVLALDAALAL